MSYSQKPSAWVRPQGNQSQQLNPNLFTNQIGLAAAAGPPFSAMSGMALGSSINALVNQAAFSNMNSVLAQAQRAQLMPQQQVSQQQQRPQQSTSPSRSNQRTFLGTVTKLMETYGFVDEDVFFQTNVIRGAMPRVGDRVMVEASYNPSMPFKWNAFRIQLIQQDTVPPAMQQQHQQKSAQQQNQRHVPQQQHQMHVHNGSSGGGRWAPPQDRAGRDEQQQRHAMTMDRHRPGPPMMRRPSPRMEARRASPPPPRQQQRSPLPRRSPRKVSPPRKSTDAPAKRERERSPSVRESTRERSSKRDLESPPRRRQRIIPRYSCNLPKQIVSSDEMKYVEIRKRYSSLYVPSDFIRCKMSWLDSIQLDSPLKFSPHPIIFHVLHKDIDVPFAEGEAPAVETPPDADSRYIVKVLLLAHPGISTLRQKTYGLLPDGSIDEAVENQPITKNLQVLVGHRSKEPMCIGGQWSPSLDGPIPTDPQTMINTAVRTTRALTGVDLSGCPRWYKMVHLRYFRVERQRVDSVVLMLPDLGATVGLMPSAEEFSALEERLRQQLAAKLAAIDAEEFIVEKSTAQPEAEPNATVDQPNGQQQYSEKTTSATSAAEMPSNAAEPALAAEAVPAAAATVEGDSVAAESQESAAEGDASTNTADSTTAELPAATPAAPKVMTHWSKLNAKAMKVAELRDELELRGLDSKGVKNILTQRLQEALDKEKAEDPEPQTEQTEEAQPAADESEKDTSMVVQIKEELVELMETDEAGEDKEETANNEELVEKPDDLAEKQLAEKLEKERQELEKAKEKFEKEKKERKATLERHFVIPKEPGVLVYPSKTAKSGKFECKVFPISSLLEYRQEDNKETSFEVFVFAEALKETLDRGNAFTVYQSLSTALDKESETKRRNETLTEALAKDDDDVQILDTETANKDGSTKEVEKPKPAPTAVDMRTQFKALVHDVTTFSAFAHFDTNVCGYLMDRDLEEVIHSIGLDLSRGDVQRLVKKVSTKDRVNYRNLTDKWVDKDGNVKYFPAPQTEAPTPAELAKGHASQIQPEESDAGGTASTVLNGATPDVTGSGVVFYKGSIMNIHQSMELHAAVEKERSEALLKSEQLEMQLKTTKDQRDHLDKKKRRLEDDLERYKKKLHSTEKSLKTALDDSTHMKSALMDCKRYGERLVGVVDKVFPPPPPPKKEEDKDDVIMVIDEVSGTETTAAAKPNDTTEKKEGTSVTEQSPVASSTTVAEASAAVDDQPTEVATTAGEASSATVTATGSNEADPTKTANQEDAK